MNTCGTAIGQDSAPDCTTPPASGMSDYFHIIDWYEFQLATVTLTGRIYSAIALTTVGQEAAKIECLPNTIDAVWTEQGPGADGQKTYVHEVGAMLQGVGETEKAARRNYALGKYVVIARVNGGSDEDSFQVLGLKNGLTMEQIVYDSKANNGSVPGRFISPTGGASAVFESEEPYNFWITDLATTLAAITALETPVV